MLTPEPGTWYIVVTCEKCKSTIFLFPDLTKGKSLLHANYVVTCPRCDHKGGYLARHCYHSGEAQPRNVTPPSPAATGYS